LPYLTFDNIIAISITSCQLAGPYTCCYCYRGRKMARRWCVIFLMKFFATSSFSSPTTRTSSTPDSPDLVRSLCLKRTVSGGDFARFTSQTLSGTRCYVQRRTSIVSAGNSFTLDCSGLALPMVIRMDLCWQTETGHWSSATLICGSYCDIDLQASFLYCYGAYAKAKAKARDSYIAHITGTKPDEPHFTVIGSGSWSARANYERANEQLDLRQQLANTLPPQSTTPGLHPLSIHQLAPPERTFDCSLVLIYRLRKDERLNWPSWLTSSRRFTRNKGLHKYTYV